MDYNRIYNGTLAIFSACVALLADQQEVANVRLLIDSRSSLYPAPSVRELKPPFMKGEDQSRAYRPLIYETDVWPHPKTHSDGKSQSL